MENYSVCTASSTSLTYFSCLKSSLGQNEFSSSEFPTPTSFFSMTKSTFVHVEDKELILVRVSINSTAISGHLLLLADMLLLILSLFRRELQRFFTICSFRVPFIPLEMRAQRNPYSSINYKSLKSSDGCQRALLTIGLRWLFQCSRH